MLFQILNTPTPWDIARCRPLLGAAILTTALITPCAAIALPPPEDLPEEVLRVEMLVESRDGMGQPIDAGTYAQIQQAVNRRNQDNPQVAEELQSLLLQLRLLNLIKSLVPFRP